MPRRSSFPAVRPGRAAPLGLRRVLRAASALILLLSAAPSRAQSVRGDLWVANGGVGVVETSGNTIYVAGAFTQIGPSSGTAVPLDAVTGSALALPKVDSTVNAIIPDGAGGWYIGGNFTHVGGVARSHVARLNPDHSLAAWDPGADGNVQALALSGSTLYVGGSFTSIGGQSRNRIAALNTTTGLATAWNPNANATVLALVVSGATLYAGGSFTSIGGLARNRIAALTTAGGTATAWNPNANGAVYALALDAGTMYAGGQFTLIGGLARNRIAALSVATGAALAGWDPNASSDVRALVVSGSLVYAGGFFSSIGGISRAYLGALDATTGLATAWNPAPGSNVYALALSGSKLIAGGDFLAIGGQSRSHVGAVDVGTGLATAWDPNANNRVLALAVNGSTVYAGGLLSSVGGQTRNGLAALDATTGMVTSWDPNADAAVYAMAVRGGTVYVGGAFTSVGGQSRSHVAAIDAATGAATAWNPSADADVYAMTVKGTALYAGGIFSTIGGQARNRIAALDPSGLATAWNPGADADVYALAASGGTVYAGGLFASLGGQARSRIGAIDATSGLATSWNPNASSTVWALAVDGSLVYAGGTFNTIGGQTRNGIAALDAAGYATSWDPNAGSVTAVYALATGPGVVYAGGSFTTIGGQARNRIAALDPATGLAKPWNPGASSSVFWLRPSGPTVYVGGSFLGMGGLPQSAIAGIAASPAITASVPAEGGNAGSVTVTHYGGGWVPGAVPKLTRSGEPDLAGTVVTTASDGTWQSAIFDLNGATAGAWDVVVATPDGQVATRTGGFTIQGIEGPQLRVKILGLSLGGGPGPAGPLLRAAADATVIRRDRRTALDIAITNPGNVDAVDVPFWLAGVPLDATVEADFPITAPPQSGGEPNWNTVPLYFTSPGGKYLAFVIPRVPPGTTFRRFYLTVPGPSHPPFTLISSTTPPWASDAVFRGCILPGGIGSPTCMGLQLDGIHGFLAANPQITALSGIGVWAKEAWACEGAGTLSAALVKAEQVMDYLDQFAESGTAPAGCENALQPRWRDVQAVTVVNTLGPNEKLGAQGTLSGQLALPYSVRFENPSTATGPVQDVIVSDPLDAATLDVNTVSLDMITFGSAHLYPPPGLSSYAAQFDLRPAKNLLLTVVASLDPFTKVLSWYFQSIDPVTGMTPSSPAVGALPPDVTPPEGEGSVLFTVLPRTGATTVSNSASILFDDPPALNTPSWANGLDDTPPASHVLPLPAQSNLATIPVSWTADGAPPDLRDFTIYVKEDAAPYRVWRLNTPTTSDTLSPPPDHHFHSYAFYSVARDQIGNIEGGAPVADATTQSTTAVGGADSPRWALEGARPNPVVGELTVAFSLSGRERATLELLDVGGRRVWKREVGSLGPGPHLVTLTPERPLAPGLYFLRLARGADVLRTRVAVVR